MLFWLFLGSKRVPTVPGVSPVSRNSLLPLEAFDHHIHVLFYKVKNGLDGVELGFGVEVEGSADVVFGAIRKEKLGG